ncbi:MAG: DUF72 domain-containing protein [Lewinella sp.]|nr:DUF72 domain-containing protein [Lewinella sp.]
MKFGKLADISGVDFSLPPDPPANGRFWTELPRDPGGRMTVYTGCTGWSMAEWVGKWYPAGTKSKSFLTAYGRQFNTIELNTTHYRIPAATTIEQWTMSVPRDFRFCPKIPQRISHDGNLGLPGDQLPLFWEALARFGDQLGACFLQLPPYFDTSRREILDHFLQQWPREFPLAVELRHPSWFASAEQVDNLARLLYLHGAGALITGVAGRRDVLHLLVTAPFAMVRFVGNGLDPTDYERIDQWCRHLGDWQAKGLRTVFFFPHEPDNLLAPELTAYFSAQLQQQAGIHTRGPAPVNSPEPGGEQMSLF